jgi:hypothetical protein
MSFEPQRVPIGDHALFCSDETERPFERCLVCETSLQEGGTPYIVEKAYRRNAAYDVDELIFECALCLSCRGDLIERFSDHSLECVNDFYREHLNVADRLARLSGGSDGGDVEARVDRCMFQGTPREEMKEYQVVAFARGPWLKLDLTPALIGGGAADALSEDLSRATRDEGGRFWEEHLGPSPDVQKLLDGPVPV